MKTDQCHYCGVRWPVEYLTRDHIVPRSLGGTSGLYNLVRACRKCNSSKGQEMPTCKCEKCAMAVKRYHRRMRKEVLLQKVPSYVRLVMSARSD